MMVFLSKKINRQIKESPPPTIKKPSERFCRISPKASAKNTAKKKTIAKPKRLKMIKLTKPTEDFAMSLKLYNFQYESWELTAS